MANIPANSQEVIDTSWVSPMGKRAKMLIDQYNSEDPDRKAEAAEKIVMVCEAMQEMIQTTGESLTEAQKALMEVYEEIRQQDPSLV